MPEVTDLGNDSAGSCALSACSLCSEAPPAPSRCHTAWPSTGSQQGCGWRGALRPGSSAVGADVTFVAPPSNSSPYASGHGVGHSLAEVRGATWEGNPTCPGAGVLRARQGSQPLGWGPREGMAVGTHHMHLPSGTGLRRAQPGLEGTSGPGDSRGSEPGALDRGWGLLLPSPRGP